MTSLVTGSSAEVDFHLQTVTFEDRSENKTCSAWPKDRHNSMTYDILHVTARQTVTFEHPFQTFNFWFPAFVWLSDIFSPLFQGTKEMGWIPRPAPPAASEIKLSLKMFSAISKMVWTIFVACVGQKLASVLSSMPKAASWFGLFDGCRQVNPWLYFWDFKISKDIRGCQDIPWYPDILGYLA